MENNNKTIDNKTRRYCLYIGLLACLLAIIVTVSPVSAISYWNFDDLSAGSQYVDGFTDSCTIDDDPDARW